MKGKKQKEPVGFNPAEIFAALALLEKERGIPQSFMMEKIVQALTTAYKPEPEDVRPEKRGGGRGLRGPRQRDAH